MRLPNLLATRWGRMTAFFFLYVTEGIPLGFAAVAVATQMRRGGLGPAAIGAFIASFYWPWAFKWVMGPIVDTITWRRFGRRKTWIVGAQILMAATLLAATPIDFVSGIALFTSILLVHNTFAATQDVAIDALAVSVLDDSERGLANGVMFAGAYLGQAIGGSGVLLLTQLMPFRSTFLFVALAIVAVTVFIVLPLREPDQEPAPENRSLAAIAGQIWDFAVTAGRSLFGRRESLAALGFALLPCGAHALGLTLQSNLAVELGLDDPSVARLNLWSTVLSAAGCVAGGLLSDRFGRRRMLVLYVAAMSLPTLFLALRLQQHGWVLPVDIGIAGRAAVPAALVTALWLASLAYAVCNGLMYGTRTALFMDVTNPLVAATQFTAYMALLNLVLSYSAAWQGWAAERWGYPLTLVADAGFGLLCLAFLPWIRRPAPPPAAA